MVDKREVALSFSVLCWIACTPGCTGQRERPAIAFVNNTGPPPPPPLPRNVRRPTPAPVPVPAPAPVPAPVPEPAPAPVAQTPELAPVSAPVPAPNPIVNLVPGPAPAPEPASKNGPSPLPPPSPLSTGALAGIVVGGAVGALFAALVTFLLVRRRKQKQKIPSLPSNPEDPPKKFDAPLPVKDIDMSDTLSPYASSSTGPTSQTSSSLRGSATPSIIGSIGNLSISSDMGFKELPAHDWQPKADNIIFVKDSKGAPLRLGSGAYGTVYMATIDGVTEVAVKIFHDAQSQREKSDILREVAILKGCRDRHIVQFLGACLLEERVLLVTEFMEAGDLWHAIQLHQESKALSWYNRGKVIAIEVARGLYFLHSHKIIHFDLKSANVLLTRDNAAKISDVGFANILSHSHLSQGEKCGFTFAWAAPEVLMGAKLTEKVDIYSYGVLLWEIVTGEHPRRGQLRPCRVPEECPQEVEDLMQMCLSFNPEHRPSCKEIVKILARLQADTQSSLPASTPHPHVGRQGMGPSPGNGFGSCLSGV